MTRGVWAGPKERGPDNWDDAHFPTSEALQRMWHGAETAMGVVAVLQLVVDVAVEEIAAVRIAAVEQPVLGGMRTAAGLARMVARPILPPLRRRESCLHRVATLLD